MEALASYKTFHNEDMALRSLFDTFGCVLSLEDIASAFCKAGKDPEIARELLSGMQTSPSADTFSESNDRSKDETSKSADSNSFIKSSYASGIRDDKSSRLKRSSMSRGMVGKEYVWRAKSVDTVHVSNDLVKNETSKSADVDDSSKSSDANGSSDEKASRLKMSYTSRNTFVKEYVWRAKARQDASLASEVTLKNPSADAAHLTNDSTKMGDSIGKSSDENACNNNSCIVNGSDDSKASRFRKFPSSLVDSSVHRKDYVWRVRGEQDANLEGEVLRETQTSPSLNLTHASDSWVNYDAPPQSASNTSFTKPCYPNGNTNYPQSRLRWNPVSVGTVSSVHIKDYVWRPKGQNANMSGVTADVFDSGMKITSESSDDNASSKSSSENGNVDSQPSSLKNNPVYLGTSSVNSGKGCVWRVRRKGTPNEPEPLKAEVDKNLESVYPFQDFEDFLLDILGPGFQLEKSAIQKILGNCKFDMKKSLDTVLDLAAATLDRRNASHDLGINLNSNQEALSSQSQVQKRKLLLSSSRAMRCNEILSRQPNDRDDLQKEGLSALICDAERLESTKENRDLVVARDGTEEDGYQILRRTAKEYRDKTNEYYRAVTKAFSSGDLAQAIILLEKGQFFQNKAREADEKASEKIFEIRDGEMKDDVVLDLLQHNAKEAIHLVKCHLRSLSGIPSIKSLKIVVGIGEGDVGKCKHLVIKLLEKEAIEWEEDEDSGTISVCLDKINPKHLTFSRK